MLVDWVFSRQVIGYLTRVAPVYHESYNSESASENASIQDGFNCRGLLILLGGNQPVILTNL